LARLSYDLFRSFINLAEHEELFLSYNVVDVDDGIQEDLPPQKHLIGKRERDQLYNAYIFNYQ
jgi:hypothetical protein